MGLEIDQEAFARAHRDGAVVIDVREPEEYRAGHVPGARLIPLGVLPVRLDDVPTGQRVYVVCASGGRSAQATGLLRRAGVDAWSVAGGTSDWSRRGGAVATGEEASR